MASRTPRPTPRRRKAAPRTVIAKVFEADLSAPVVAAGTRIQNVRQITERVAMGRALWRGVVVGVAPHLGAANLGVTQLPAVYVLGGGGGTAIARPPGGGRPRPPAAPP